MKHTLFIGASALMMTCSPLSVQAQNYGQSYSKGEADTRVMNDAQRIDVDRRTSVATNVEPAAGGDSYNDDPYEDFTGIYAGGDLGYSLTEDVEGMNGSLFLGYGFEHDMSILGAYAGVEVAHEWSGADGDAGTVSYEKDHAWLATFRPGISVYDDALGYAIVGYSRAEFEAAEAEENVDGLVLGVGAQLNTQTAFKPRLEYTYTNYEEAEIAGSNFDPQENTIKLGAVFQF